MGSEFLAVTTKFRCRRLEAINRDAWRWPRHKVNKHRIGLMDTLNSDSEVLSDTYTRFASPGCVVLCCEVREIFERVTVTARI